MAAKPRLRFVVSRDAAGLRLKALVAVFAVAMLVWSAAIAVNQGAIGAVVIALSAATLFGSLGLAAWRRASGEGPLLEMNERQLSINDGLGQEWAIPWNQVERVYLERLGLTRSVVVETFGPQASRRRIPHACRGEVPVEWLAGLIDTFRDRALRGPSTADSSVEDRGRRPSRKRDQLA